jgi:hypothetical protein
MTDDEVRNYLMTYVKLDSAIRKVHRMEETIQKVVDSLRNHLWDFQVLDTLYMKMSPTASASKEFAGLANHKWPSADQIAEDIRDIHTLRNQLISTYMALSSSDKEMVPPPPKGTALSKVV